MMVKKYINEQELQIAISEYNPDMELGHVVETQYEKEVATFTQVYDNISGAGEQVYAVVRRDDQTNSIKNIYVMRQETVLLDRIS